MGSINRIALLIVFSIIFLGCANDLPRSNPLDPLYNNGVGENNGGGGGSGGGTIATPVILPIGGTFYDFVNIAISCNAAHVLIWYTTDGSEPTSSSGSGFVGPSFNITSSCTVKAKAYGVDGNTDAPSATATATFIITH